MSTDRRVTKDLIQTLEDGQTGFTQAADKLADSDRPDLAPRFREFAEQRARFSQELETMAAQYGDDIDEDGSVAGTIHRGWMALKDALSGSDPDGVLDAAEQGEAHAVSEYEKALAEDISTDLRRTVQRHYETIRATHNSVRALRTTVS